MPSDQSSEKSARYSRQGQVIHVPQRAQGDQSGSQKEEEPKEPQRQWRLGRSSRSGPVHEHEYG